MALMRHLTPIAGLLTLFSAARATSLVSIESATRLTAEPALFERVDFVVTLTGQWQDPYRAADIRLDLELQTPSGKPVLIPGYYERGESGTTSVWHTRMAPRETGRYNGRFVLNNHGTRHESEPLAFDVAPSNARGFLHPGNMWSFRFDNGEAFRGLGENLCWESRSFDDSRHFKSLHENQRYNYEYLIGTLKANGGNFFRTWMCPWNLPLEWKQPLDTARYRDDPGHFNASAIQRMDELIELAHATDTYFMLALDAHGSLLGHGWDASSYNVKNGGPCATPADFFTNPEARSQYQDRLRYLVARWGYSPHLAVWEFFNEVDNAMYGQKPARIPDEPVMQWHREMSEYLKGIDPAGRLVTTSVSHRDVTGLAALPGMDFNQRHIYRNTDTIPEIIRRYIRDTGKPYVIGEYSYEWDWTKNFNEFSGQMDDDFRRGLWLGLFSPTPIMPMSWWWEFFDERRLPVYFKRVRAVHEQMLAAGRGDYQETAVRWEGGALRHVLAVKCGRTTFVLLQNTEKSPVAGQLVIPTAARKHLSGQLYDTGENETREALFNPTESGVFASLKIPANNILILTLTEQ